MLGDYDFIKYYVCVHNKWNPYGDEVKRIPSFYWMNAFNMIKIQSYMNWENIIKPQAELIGAIANPEVYQEYLKQKARNLKTLSGKEVKTGNKVTAQSDAHYEPGKGLVDETGKILIDDERYKMLTNTEGIMIGI